jgi:hypothetical protein
MQCSYVVWDPVIKKRRRREKKRAAVNSTTFVEGWFLFVTSLL